MLVLVTVILYFLALLLLSRLAAKGGGNDAFFVGNRQSPWMLVAFGMVGASISGLTFIGVPGWVMSTDMTYLQMCMGFVVGYLIVAFVLLPLYYRHKLTSIYAYLNSRFGNVSYKTGASFFIFSKLLGAAAKFYIVCRILQACFADTFSVPYVVVVLLASLLIWLYTHRGGIRTLVWTDFFQTLCLLVALILILMKVVEMLDMNFSEAMIAVWNSPHSRIFEFSDIVSKQNFWKQFLSGVFVDCKILAFCVGCGCKKFF
jgi:Na+/proline symporter